MWRPNSPGSDTYDFQDSLLMHACITSEATLGDGETARFHFGGPLPGVEGLSFNEGDIIGILFRTDVAAFVPYLYNTSIINPFRDQSDEELLGYFLTIRNERPDLSLRNLQSAPMLPMLALDLCKF